MFLNSDELADLTGKKQSRKQALWLSQNGYPFEVNAAGHPRVLRAFVVKKLGGITAPRRREPNLTPAVQSAA